MILVTGGAYAGKMAYVQETCHISAEEILDGNTCSFSEALTAACIRNYHVLIRRLLAEGENPLEFTENLLYTDPERIIIMNEIGCGIIPLAKEERIWREQTGRCGSLLAEHAETVIRICCGCASCIKGELP